MSRSGLELVVFVGLQGAGKTTCYRCCFARTHEHISKDAWPNAPASAAPPAAADRSGAGGWPLGGGRQHQPGPRGPVPLVTAARTHDAVAVAVWFPVSVGECLACNLRRQGRARVPEVAILSTARRLRPPSIQEGFYRVQIARMTAARTFELEESATAADPWPVGGRLWHLDQ